ncbi:MAG: CPBP family intramembrane metalloprotease [Spirochaetales bacterium]|nr:CPBP family intramembrane metalloprotease [Spirochaetales bacterium]
MKDQKIRKPMYAKEGMGRLVKWFFGLPLIFIIYIILSMVMPHGQADQRIRLLFNIISYIVFIAVTIVVVVRFLKFPFMKMISQGMNVRIKPMLIGFCAMFALGAGTTFIWKAVSPGSFTFSLQSGWPLDFLLSFVLVGLAAFLEEILCRSYVAYFVKDDLETRPKQKLYYCLASAVVFTIFHFQNPEVHGSQAVYAMVFYFIMGFALMAVTLRTRGIEAAIGIHLANNLVNAWLFTYKDAALITNAVYTHSNNIGPWMLVQTVFCVVLSSVAVILSSEKPAAKV